MWAQEAGVTALVRATGKTQSEPPTGGVTAISRAAWRGLERNATRPGRKPPLDAATIERVVNLTLNEKPPTAPHWSARTLAKRSASAIRACSASGQRTGSNRI